MKTISCVVFASILFISGCASQYAPSIQSSNKTVRPKTDGPYQSECIAKDAEFIALASKKACIDLWKCGDIDSMPLVLSIYLEGVAAGNMKMVMLTYISAVSSRDFYPKGFDDDMARYRSSLLAWKKINSEVIAQVVSNSIPSLDNSLMVDVAKAGSVCGYVSSLADIDTQKQMMKRYIDMGKIIGTSEPMLIVNAQKIVDDFVSSWK